MSTLRITHPTLGPIIVVRRSGSRKLSARWINGQLHINIPAGVPDFEIGRAIERHRPDFEAIRPKPRYSVGQTIDTHNFSFSIAKADKGQDGFRIYIASDSTGTHPRFVISVPDSEPTDTPRVQQAISRCLHLAARKLAPAILLPKARETAERLNLKVDKWEIASGKTTLGTCFPSQRRIRLSYMCVFLDPELRNYIICHELAHLTEPGHTPAFHRLCDSYCSGRESEFISRLRNYPWPVDR